jgi:hypothetical protein
MKYSVLPPFKKKNNDYWHWLDPLLLSALLKIIDAVNIDPYEKLCGKVFIYR